MTLPALDMPPADETRMAPHNGDGLVVLVGDRDVVKSAASLFPDLRLALATSRSPTAAGLRNLMSQDAATARSLYELAAKPKQKSASEKITPPWQLPCVLVISARTVMAICDHAPRSASSTCMLPVFGDRADLDQGARRISAAAETSRAGHLLMLQSLDQAGAFPAVAAHIAGLRSRTVRSSAVTGRLAPLRRPRRAQIPIDPCASSLRQSRSRTHRSSWFPSGFPAARTAPPLEMVAITPWGYRVRPAWRNEGLRRKSLNNAGYADLIDHLGELS